MYGTAGLNSRFSLGSSPSIPGTLSDGCICSLATATMGGGASDGVIFRFMKLLKERLRRLYTSNRDVDHSRGHIEARKQAGAAAAEETHTPHTRKKARRQGGSRNSGGAPRCNTVRKHTVSTAITACVSFRGRARFVRLGRQLNQFSSAPQPGGPTRIEVCDESIIMW